MVDISIIMPVYNCGEFLKTQIDSLLMQSFKEFELIIINDGSTDHTLAIVNDFLSKDDRIKLVNNEYSKGIAGALNTGLKYACGKYIARADGDDINHSERLKVQYNFLEDHPEIDIIGSRAMIFNSSGFIRESVYPESPIELCWKFISNTYFCHPSVMFRSVIVEAIGGYPNVVVEDFAYFSLILKRHRGSNLPIQLLNYREHEKNYSTSNYVEINNFVEHKFRENYQYYVGDLTFLENFRLFQVYNQVSPKHFFKLFFINIRILNKIRIDYGMRYYNSDFVLNMIKQTFWLTNSVFNYLRLNFL